MQGMPDDNHLSYLSPGFLRDFDRDLVTGFDTCAEDGYEHQWLDYGRLAALHLAFKALYADRPAALLWSPHQWTVSRDPVTRRQTVTVILTLHGLRSGAYPTPEQQDELRHAHAQMSAGMTLRINIQGTDYPALHLDWHQDGVSLRVTVPNLTDADYRAALQRSRQGGIHRLHWDAL
jgi:hypothetical protein